MPAPIQITVAEFKAEFSAALDAVRAGRTVVVTYGRQRRKVAALVPYASIAPARRRSLGVLKGRASIRIGRNFAITDEDLLRS